MRWPLINDNEYTIQEDICKNTAVPEQNNTRSYKIQQ